MSWHSEKADPLNFEHILLLPLIGSFWEFGHLETLSKP
jgi:hypothetical protein